MGKYDAVLTRLAPLPPADPSYQTKVDTVKAEVINRDATALAEAYKRFRVEQDRLKNVIYDVNLKLEALTQLLVESQEADAEGWGAYGATSTTLRLVSGDKIQIQKEPYGQVKDKEAFRLWCVANGYETQLQLWPSTMNAVVKERLLDGKPTPDGTEAYVRDKLVYTAFKPGKVGDE